MPRRTLFSFNLPSTIITTVTTVCCFHHRHKSLSSRPGSPSSNLTTGKEPSLPSNRPPRHPSRLILTLSKLFLALLILQTLTDADPFSSTSTPLLAPSNSTKLETNPKIMASKRRILTAPHAIAKAEKAAREQLDEANEQMDELYTVFCEEWRERIKVFREKHAKIHDERVKIQDALLDRLSDEGQARVKGYHWFKRWRADANSNIMIFDKSAWGGWQSIEMRQHVDSDPAPLAPDPKLRLRILPGKNGDEFEYLDGEDEQGNCIPENLGIDSDEVSPKALAELAMAAVRITNRHRESVEGMAGFEETARRVLKRARIEGKPVAPPVDPEEEYMKEFQAHQDRIHPRKQAAALKNRYTLPPKHASGQTSVRPPNRAAPAPALTRLVAATHPAPAPAATVPAPAPAPGPAGLRKIRIGKEKIAAAAAAATPALSSSPAAIPSTSDASASPISSPPVPPRRSSSPPRTRLPSPPPRRSRIPRSASPAPTPAPAHAPPSSPAFPVVPETPPAPRRQPRRGCRKSTNMKLPSSDLDDSDR